MHVKCLYRVQSYSMHQQQQLQSAALALTSATALEQAGTRLLQLSSYWPELSLQHGCPATPQGGSLALPHVWSPCCSCSWRAARWPMKQRRQKERSANGYICTCRLCVLSESAPIRLEEGDAGDAAATLRPFLFVNVRMSAFCCPAARCTVRRSGVPEWSLRAPSRMNPKL